MAENTNNKKLDDPANTKSENQSEEVFPIKDKEIITQNQGAENMKVHHHPKVEKKNFKEYFLEFVMIFIAVTLGFFAESLREHIKDNEETHENIQSVLADLESDVAHFNSILDMNIYGYTAADSLISLLHNISTHNKFIFMQGQQLPMLVTSIPIQKPSTR